MVSIGFGSFGNIDCYNVLYGLLFLLQNFVNLFLLLIIAFSKIIPIAGMGMIDQYLVMSFASIYQINSLFLGLVIYLYIYVFFYCLVFINWIGHLSMHFAMIISPSYFNIAIE